VEVATLSSEGREQESLILSTPNILANFPMVESKYLPPRLCNATDVKVLIQNFNFQIQCESEERRCTLLNI